MIQGISRRWRASATALATGALLFASAPLTGQAGNPSIVQVEAPGSVAQVVSKLKKMVGQNGMMVMGNLDQGKVLSMTGLHVQSETLFVGNPQVGKQLFSADPGVGLVVPVRVNVYQNGEGKTMVSYLPPSVLLKDYGSPAIDKVAHMLDMKLHRMVSMLGS